MNQTRNLISLILALFAVMILSNTALADFTSGDWTYTVENDGLKITGYNGNDAEVIVPAELDGQPVVAVGFNVFYSNNELNHLVFSEGIRYISNDCAYDCPNLTDVWLPSEVDIDAGMASGVGLPTSQCHSLQEYHIAENNPFIQSVNGVVYSKDMKSLLFYPTAKKDISYVVPQGVENIGSSSFEDNYYIQNVTLPDTVKGIGYWAFSGCSSLRQINILEGCTFLGEYAFHGCSALQSLHLPSTLTVIVNPAFDYSSLRDITVASGNPVYFVSDGILRTNDTLVFYLRGQGPRDYVIPNGITRIAREAFVGDASIRGVTIPESVRVIEFMAFFNCSNLRYMKLPYSMDRIEDFVCPTNYSCFLIGEKGSIAEQLASQSENSCFLEIGQTTLGGELDDRITWTLHAFTGALTIDGEGAIPEADSNLPWFKYRGFIESIEVHDGVTALPTYAFVGTMAKSVVLGNNVSSIGSCAFAQCRQLESLILPKNVSSIGGQCFEYCDQLKKLVVLCPNTTFESYPFYNCSPTIYGYVGSTAEAYAVERDLPFVAIESSGDYYRDSWLYNCCLPEPLQAVPEQGFMGDYRLTSVWIPDGCKSIGSEAFAGCTGLQYVRIPSSVTSIAQNVFLNCDNIIIVAQQGSEAERFAKANHLRLYGTDN